eukprot:NODE_24488_length_623_cov_2.308468.p3 GENE.NODE_24488_length_623_cov_2.308468~~NODE_24488_length_623_cov_2.308468.p3  ORF type:complete len:56 (-),score=7.79 NODE_24488_length_623_cov_2.308468:252-419(-)
MRACMRACVRARVRTCARACVRACVRGHVDRLDTSRRGAAQWLKQQWEANPHALI